MLLQLRQSPFLSIPIAVFTASLLALKRAGLLATRWGCRLGSWTQLDRVTVGDGNGHHRLRITVHSRVGLGTEALGEVCHCFVHVFYGSSSQMVCKRTFNSSSSWALAGVYGTLPACPSDGFKFGVVGHSFFSMNPFSSSDALTLRNNDCLGWNSVILSLSDTF